MYCKLWLSDLDTKQQRFQPIHAIWLSTCFSGNKSNIRGRAKSEMVPTRPLDHLAWNGSMYLTDTVPKKQGAGPSKWNYRLNRFCKYIPSMFNSLQYWMPSFSVHYFPILFPVHDNTSFLLSHSRTWHCSPLHNLSFMMQKRIFNDLCRCHTKRRMVGAPLLVCHRISFL